MPLSSPNTFDCSFIIFSTPSRDLAMDEYAGKDPMTAVIHSTAFASFAHRVGTGSYRFGAATIGTADDNSFGILKGTCIFNAH